MTRETFNEAMDIITQSHSTEIIINKPNDNGSIPTERTIHIKSAVPKVLERLMYKGYILNLKNGYLSVTKP